MLCPFPCYIFKFPHRSSMVAEYYQFVSLLLYFTKNICSEFCFHSYIILSLSTAGWCLANRMWAQYNCNVCKPNTHTTMVVIKDCPVLPPPPPPTYMDCFNSYAEGESVWSLYSLYKHSGTYVYLPFSTLLLRFFFSFSFSAVELLLQAWRDCPGVQDIAPRTLVGSFPASIDCSRCAV